VATNNRMALLEQLSKYVVEKDKDFLKEALTLLINALMDGSSPILSVKSSAWLKRHCHPSFDLDHP